MSWSFGSSENYPSGRPVPVSPTAGQIYFNQTSHASNSRHKAYLDWQWPTSSASLPSDWRIYFDLDPDMAGTIMFDSRTSPSLFDLNGLTFTPDQDIDYGMISIGLFKRLTIPCTVIQVQHRIISFQIPWERN